MVVFLGCSLFPMGVYMVAYYTSTSHLPEARPAVGGRLHLSQPTLKDNWVTVHCFSLWGFQFLSTFCDDGRSVILLSQLNSNKWWFCHWLVKKRMTNIAKCRRFVLFRFCIEINHITELLASGTELTRLLGDLLQANKTTNGTNITRSTKRRKEWGWKAEAHLKCIVVHAVLRLLEARKANGNAHAERGDFTECRGLLLNSVPAEYFTPSLFFACEHTRLKPANV